jgi:hypothetical protein
MAIDAEIAMFAQGGGHSQYRTGGQSGLFSTPQQSSSFSSSEKRKLSDLDETQQLFERTLY